MEHLQECMPRKEMQLQARAEDMRDSVSKRVEMALIRYTPQVTTMDVLPRQTGNCGSQRTREMRQDKRSMNKGSA